MKLTGLSSDSNSGCHFVTKGSRHGETWDVFALKPDSQWPNRVLVRVTEGVDSSSAVKDARGLIVLTGLLVPTDCLCHNLAILRVLDNDSTRVTDVDTEEFLAEGHHADTSGA